MATLKLTKETCHQEALKYETKSEFKKGNPGAYDAAWKNGWLDKWFEDRRELWNDEEICHQEALKYKTKTEFSKGNISAYRAARKNGWLDKWFENRLESWDEEKCHQEALKYKTKSEFSKGNGSAYQAALRKGWLDKWFKNQLKSLWNDEEICYQEALKYKTKNEFQKGNGSAYQAALKKGWLDKWFENQRESWDDEEKCRQESLKYKTKNEFQKGNSGAYKAARRKGWLDKWFENQYESWDNEEKCHQEALKYKTKIEFKKGNSGAYRAALRKGWLDKWFENQLKLWNDEETCHQEALKYKTKNEFNKGNGSAYQVARRKGWLDKWFENQYESWDNEEKCHQEALKYKTKIEFQKGNGSAYTAARRNGWLDKWFENQHESWDEETCYQEALKYKTKNEFQKGNQSAYQAACRNGWLDKWFENQYESWDEEKCHQEALKYKTKNEFSKGNSGAYQAAFRKGWLDKWFKNQYFYREDKLSLLESSDLENMSDHQLIELIGQNVLPNEFKVLIKSESGSAERKNDIRNLRKQLSDTIKSEDEIEDEIDNEIKQAESEIRTTDAVYSNIDSDTETQQTEIDKQSLPELTTQELKIYDKYFVSYGEKNEYISKESINRIWNNVLTDISYIETLKDLRKTSGNWLSYIIDTFFEEFKAVNNETVGDDYKFHSAPNLMQKLMSYRIATNPYYGNWCGTGAGKTNAFLIATRRVNARITLCICPNSVVKTIEKSIIKIYPNSNIKKIESINDIKSFDKSKYNYIIFNYEKFSQSYSKDMVEKLVSLNDIDFICFDEVQRSKNIDSYTYQNIAYLRMLANDKNPNMKVLGMTATPLINNIEEVRTILELITGTSFKEYIPNNNNTINNIHNAYKYLMLYGFRFVPDYDIVCNEEKVKITADDELAYNLINYRNSNINDIEGNLIKIKYDNIKKYIIPHRTIIYSHFIEKLIPNIRKLLKNDGITFCEYTGEIDSKERNKIIDQFYTHAFDVILASSPIATGVDGLQEYCDTIIILSLPWTNADYTQLIGRINRQGSNFKKVDIIIPEVCIRLNNGEIWSWDESRYNIIKTKRTLSDAVVDGIFASIFNLNRKKLLNNAIESLKNGITDFTVVRKKLEIDCSANVSTREYMESVINSVHQKANTSTSSTMHNYFISNPDKWREYHRIREENKKEWVEDPIDVIAEKLNRFQNLVIADLGCGTNQLKTKVNSYLKWYSVDHYSDDDTVIKADMSDLKEYIDDSSVDAAVFCMSLWGTNYMDYIAEAHRILKTNGIMYIAEPKKDIENSQEIIINGTISLGFNITNITEQNGKTYIEFKKKK